MELFRFTGQRLIKEITMPVNTGCRTNFEKREDGSYRGIIEVEMRFEDKKEIEEYFEEI